MSQGGPFHGLPKVGGRRDRPPPGPWGKIRLRFVSLIPYIRLLCGIKQVGYVVIQSNVPGFSGDWLPGRPGEEEHRP